jgi:hypothetical protein
MLRKIHVSTVMTMALCACAVGGQKTTPFIKADHPGAKGHLSDQVSLSYAAEPGPGNAEVIEHIAVDGRGSSCENAAIDALGKMQKDALQKGGNALVNLKAAAGGKPASGEKGFWCVQPKGTEEWGVTWEGDIARTGGAAVTGTGEAAKVEAEQKPAEKQLEAEFKTLKQGQALTKAAEPVAASPAPEEAAAGGAKPKAKSSPKKGQPKETMEDEKAEEAF